MLMPRKESENSNVGSVNSGSTGSTNTTTDPISTKRSFTQRMGNTFRKIEKKGYNIHKRITNKLKPLNKKISDIAVSYGLKQRTSVTRVAAMSEQASNIRATANTAASILAVTSGVIAVASLGTAIPLSAGLLGLSILIQKVAEQRGINIELQSNLMIIQHEVDRFYKIVKVMQTIAMENGFELNLGSVNVFIAKLTNFIAMLANDDVIQGIKEYRQNSTQNPLQSDKNLFIALPQYTQVDFIKLKGTYRGMMNRTLAPAEYLRQLVRDITILTVFMTMLIGEFDLFMHYIGDPNKRQWTTSPVFQSMLYDTLRFSSIAPKKHNETTEAFETRQKESIKQKFSKTVNAKDEQGNPVLDKNGKPIKVPLYHMFYKPLQTASKNVSTSLLNTNVLKSMSKEEEYKKALEAITIALKDTKEKLSAPAVVNEIEKNNEEAENQIAAVIAEAKTIETLSENVDPLTIQKINQTSNIAANAILQETTTKQGGKYKSKTRKNRKY